MELKIVIPKQCPTGIYHKSEMREIMGSWRDLIAQLTPLTKTIPDNVTSFAPYHLEEAERQIKFAESEMKQFSPGSVRVVQPMDDAAYHIRLAAKTIEQWAI